MEAVDFSLEPSEVEELSYSCWHTLPISPCRLEFVASVNVFSSSVSIGLLANVRKETTTARELPRVELVILI